MWRETGIIDRFPSKEIAIKWRAPISSGYSGPTVAAGRVYVTDRVAKPTEIERVHCFEWQTGQTIWSHAYDCKYEGFGYRAGPRASVLIDDGRVRTAWGRPGTWSASMRRKGPCCGGAT